MIVGIMPALWACLVATHPGHARHRPFALTHAFSTVGARTIRIARYAQTSEPTDLVWNRRGTVFAYVETNDGYRVDAVRGNISHRALSVRTRRSRLAESERLLELNGNRLFVFDGRGIVGWTMRHRGRLDIAEVPRRILDLSPYQARLSHDSGRLLWSGGPDGTIAYSLVDSQNALMAHSTLPRAVLASGNSIEAIEDGGKLVVTGNADDVLSIWRLDTHRKVVAWVETLGAPSESSGLTHVSWDDSNQRCALLFSPDTAGATTTAAYVSAHGVSKLGPDKVRFDLLMEQVYARGRMVVLSCLETHSSRSQRIVAWMYPWRSFVTLRRLRLLKTDLINRIAVDETGSRIAYIRRHKSSTDIVTFRLHSIDAR